MLDKLDYVFSWNRLNKVICYDIYMPWYINRDYYYLNFKTKNERKYRCIIKEKNFSSIFPLKNVIGHLVVADKNVNKNDDLLLWKTLFNNDSFKKKEDLFKELKIQIKKIDRTYNIETFLVYFFIQYI
jgi:hypothetical protein